MLLREKNWASIVLIFLVSSLSATHKNENPQREFSLLPLLESYTYSLYLNEDEINTIRNYAEYAIAAYSIGDKRYQSVSKNPKCLQNIKGISSQLPNNKQILVQDENEQILVQDESSRFAALISTNCAAKEIVVSFRGTLSKKDWLYSTHFLQTSSKPIGPIDVFIHSGFRKVYISLKENLNAQLSQMHEKYQNYQIVLTGHSLGGALALVCLLDIAFNQIVPLEKVRTITFGQPRIGGEKLTKFFQDISYQHRGLICVVNRADIIPHLPPRHLGFEHQGREYWANNGLVYKCDQDNDKKSCSSSAPFHKRTMMDHMGYLGVYFRDLCLDKK